MSADAREAYQKKAMKIKFYAYIAYLMVAIYLAKHFQTKMQETRDEHDFTSEDWRKLFSFDYQNEG